MQYWVVDDLCPLIETLGSFQICTNPKRGEGKVHLVIYSFWQLKIRKLSLTEKKKTVANEKQLHL